MPFPAPIHDCMSLRAPPSLTRNRHACVFAPASLTHGRPELAYRRRMAANSAILESGLIIGFESAVGHLPVPSGTDGPFSFIAAPPQRGNPDCKSQSWQRRRNGLFTSLRCSRLAGQCLLVRLEAGDVRDKMRHILPSSSSVHTNVAKLTCSLFMARHAWKKNLRETCGFCVVGKKRPKASLQFMLLYKADFVVCREPIFCQALFLAACGI